MMTKGCFTLGQHSFEFIQGSRFSLNSILITEKFVWNIGLEGLENDIL
jgi:hypothetical protein